MKLALPLLALALPAIAAEAPPAQIVIAARFTEADPKSGKTDVLSSPRVATREGLAAKIEIARESMLTVPDAKVNGASLKFQTGVELDVTGWIDGEGLILRGTATVRELNGEIAMTRDGAWAHLRADEIPFVLRFKNGEPRQLPIDTSARTRGKLMIELTASIHTPVNASPLYWQAFAEMPKLDDTEKKLLDSNAAGDAERALVAKADAALKLFHEASLADFCDWNLDLSKGPSLTLRHLAPMRELAKLALMKARLGDAAAALGREQTDVFRAGRHVASSPLLVSRLVGLSLEGMAIDAIAPRLPQWPGETRRSVASAVTNADPAPGIADCVAAEGKSMSAWLSTELDAEKNKGGSFDVRAWLARLLAPAGTNTDQVLKEIEQAGSLPRDAAEVRRLIDDYQTQMNDVARFVALPREQMNKEAAALEQRLRAQAPRNIFSALLAPAVIKAREAELKGELRLALFKAALDVQAKGESALPAALATYRKTEHGFELTSKELFSGKPVVLVVGPR